MAASPRTADETGLAEALARAAAAGKTSIAETLLGALVERFPAASAAAAARALGRAVSSGRWTSAAYLADYLADTNLPRARASEPSRGLQTAGAPARFRLTDAMCAERGGGKQVRRAGAPIRFTHVDPGLPPEAYGGADRPCEHFSLSDPDASARWLVGRNVSVVAPGPISVGFGFPPALAGRHAVTTSGTREGLARAIAAKCRQQLAAASCCCYDLAELDLARVRPLSDGSYAADIEALS